jgi:bla regulator protein blaR1
MNNFGGSLVPGLANHVWQSTAFAVAAWLLTILLRRNPARIRYAIWLAASIKFFIPFSLLVAVGNLLPKPKPSIAPAVYTAMHVAEQPFAGIARTSAPDAVHRATMWGRVAANIPTGLVVLWLAGAATVCFLWALHWRRVSKRLHNAMPVTQGRELEILRRLEGRLGSYLRFPLRLRLSTEQVEPSLHGMLRPVLVWPEQLSGRLNDEQIEAIMTHELVHARRFDNLTAALHMLVEAVFWFHPLVWWMERRLIEDREHACDEAVLELGNDRHTYAESILTTCKFCVGLPLPCASGVTGADLRRRMIYIMTQPVVRKLDLRKRMLLGLAAVVAVAAPFLFGWATRTGQPDAPQTADAANESFGYEVASIKLDKSGSFGFRVLNTPDGFSASTTLQVLIGVAYGIKDNEIYGGPSWVSSEKYDVEAKMDQATADQVKKLGVTDKEHALQHMLQTLLADRFQLTTHRETKELPIYSLVVAKGGSKLHEAKSGEIKGPDGRPLPRGFHLIRFGSGELTGQGLGMDEIADLLRRQTGRTVVDNTGLKGNYDLTLQWMPDQIAPAPNGTGGEGADSSTSSESGPSFFTAIQEQLGLKLESQKGPVEILAIDHVERPSEN